MKLDQEFVDILLAQVETVVNRAISGIKSDINELKADVSTLKADVSTLKADVSTLKADVSTLKADVDTLKADVSTLKADVSTLKADVSTLKADVDTLKAEMAEVKTDISIMKSTLKEHTGILKALEHRTEENTAQLIQLSEDLNQQKGTQVNQGKEIAELKVVRAEDRRIIEAMSAMVILHDSQLKTLGA